MSDRRFVFINHASPEDNPFTAWLGARLSAAGYDVWSDILVLGGGETFWNDINEGIRRKSAIFIPVLSTAAAKIEKRGVHNEIAIAVQVQRRELPDFILPIQLEPVLEPNPELVQLNYIDFSGGWAVGLARLLERLAKLAIPRRNGPDTLAMARWLQVQSHLSGAIRAEPSELLSNWFPISALPPVVRFVRSPVEKDTWEAALKSCAVPVRQHYRLAITFALLCDVQSGVQPSVPFTTEYEVPTELFLQGRAPRDTPQVAGRDARAMAVAFLRKGWDVFAESRGLKRHEMSGKDSWYVPDGLLPDGWASFVDRDGRARRRKLVGVRGKRKVRYHFAVSAKPQLLPFPRLIIRSHVVFREASGILVTDARTAQRYRKALCKSWWNAEWRDRLSAVMSHLSEGRQSFDLPLGGVSATVSSCAIVFDSPCSYDEHRPVEASDDEDDDFDDALEDEDARSGPGDDDWGPEA